MTTAVAVAELPLLLEVTLLIVHDESEDDALGVQLVHLDVVPS